MSDLWKVLEDAQGIGTDDYLVLYRPRTHRHWVSKQLVSLELSPLEHATTQQEIRRCLRAARARRRST